MRILEFSAVQFSRLHILMRLSLVMACQTHREAIRPGHAWRGDRAVEGARLEIVCAPKGYRGFESPPLRLLVRALREEILKVSRSVRSGRS